MEGMRYPVSVRMDVSSSVFFRNSYAFAFLNVCNTLIFLFTPGMAVRKRVSTLVKSPMRTVEVRLLL